MESRRENFGLGTMHREGDPTAPIENAIDKVGGDSRAWTAEATKAEDDRLYNQEREYRQDQRYREWND